MWFAQIYIPCVVTDGAWWPCAPPMRGQWPTSPLRTRRRGRQRRGPGHERLESEAQCDTAVLTPGRGSQERRQGPRRPHLLLSLYPAESHSTPSPSLSLAFNVCPCASLSSRPRPNPQRHRPHRPARSGETGHCPRISGAQGHHALLVATVSSNPPVFVYACFPMLF